MTTTNEAGQKVIPSPPSGERVRVRGRLAEKNASVSKTAFPSSGLRPPSPPVGAKGRIPGYGKQRTRTVNSRQFARQLRQRSTEVEKRLWRLLRDRRFTEFKFRRQYACGVYFLDFYCTIAKLAIELDGGGHGFPGQRTHDVKRDECIARHGIKVLRFWNHQMRGQIEAIRFEIWYAVMERLGRVKEIHNYLPKSAPSPRPSPPMGARETERQAKI
jgi:very-short-patch-repair endonuclease